MGCEVALLSNPDTFSLKPFTNKQTNKCRLSPGKCCVARSCPRRPCRLPLRLLPAACGMMSRRRRALRRRSRRARAPAVLTRTLASMEFQCAGWAWRTCRASAASSSCSCCSRWAVRAARRGDRAARVWRRAGRAGRACWACSRTCTPSRTLAKNLGGESLSTSGGVHSGCLRAACVRAPRAALSARRLVDTRAPCSHWQPAAASARTALSCCYARRTHYAPTRAVSPARPSARPLRIP